MSPSKSSFINKTVSQKYQVQEQKRQVKILKERPEWFGGDLGGAKHRDNHYAHLLQQRANNIWQDFRAEALGYFRSNQIKWHLQAHNLKSSQVACVNHLMGIRYDKALVLAMINAIAKSLSITFVDVLPLPYEMDETYIAFEVVSGGDWLGEGQPTRGSNCTSLDALVYARDTAGKQWLIPIEWKYTEKYEREDKASEGDGKGETRRSRYDHLIAGSEILKPQGEVLVGIYYQEPFYQLMRQTLWAEQIIRQTFAHRDPQKLSAFKDELFRADEMLHIHVVPDENQFVVPRRFSHERLEDLWRDCLHKPERYIRIDPAKLFAPIMDRLDEGLKEYLEMRYW